MPRILLVSKDKAAFKAISSVLPEGWDLLLCATGQQAQKYFEENPQEQDLALIDTRNRPDCASLFTQLLGKGAALLAIIEEGRMREIAFASGADDYLLWPMLPTELRARLTPYLRAPKAALTNKSSADQKAEADEQKYYQQQILHNERMMVIGHLTSHICHEINNSLQAIQGALALAMEEPGVPEQLTAYMRLCQEETQRLVTLIEKMRQLYRPSDQWGPIDLKQLLKEVFVIISERMDQNDIRMREEMDPKLPLIAGNVAQMRFLFLSILLTLIETAGAGGGELYVRAGSLEQKVSIEILTEDMTKSTADSGQAVENSELGLERFLQLTQARGIALSHHGTICVVKRDGKLGMQVNLPVLGTQ